MIVTPALGPRYWTCLCLASVLGANSGDVCSRLLGLGYWHGLPVLAVLFGLVLLAARQSPPTESWYWIAIVIVRTAATNLSDLQTLHFGVPFPIVMAAFSAMLVLLVALDRRGVAGTGVPVATSLFWAAMLVAGTLGTAAGDYLAFVRGLGPPSASVAMTVVLAGTFATRAATGARSAVSYWITVVVIRTWGTNVGDFAAHTSGLVESTVATGALLIGLLLVWKAPDRTVVAPAA